MNKPNFCVECGEKIERGAWNLWTSRRLCENCEHLEGNFRGWKSIAAGAALFVGGVFAGQIALQKPAPPAVLTKQEIVAAPSPQKATSPSIKSNTANSNAKILPPMIQTASSTPVKTVAPPLVDLKVEGDDSAFYCGAKTQKGAPCTRRVKGGGRCWQHTGKAAILPEEKLRIR